MGAGAFFWRPALGLVFTKALPLGRIGRQLCRESVESDVERERRA